VEHERAASGKLRQYRLEHGPGAIRRALAGCKPGTAVTLEATANGYWIVDEIEPAGWVRRLVHPRQAKLMRGLINKTDKLDAHGLNRRQRNGTLPTVGIPPRPLREGRELTRRRGVLVGQRTRGKNRRTAPSANSTFACVCAKGTAGQWERWRGTGPKPPSTSSLVSRPIKIRP
jgi:transposase